MKLIVLICYLIICSIIDLKQKKIPIILLGVGISIGFIYSLCQIFIKDKEITDLLLSLIPGFVLIFVCKISKGSIGMADGLMLMITGFVFMPYSNLLMIIIAFLGSFFVSCILVFIKNVRKSVTMPFIPFILFSTIIVGYIEK